MTIACSRRRVAVLSFALSVLDCSSRSDEARPPYCRTADCLPTSAPVFDTGSGGADDGGHGGAAGAGAVVTVSGQILEVDAVTFGVGAGSLAMNDFVVEAPALGGTTVQSTTSSIFSLAGVQRTRSAWVSVRPAASSDLFPGLVSFDATTTTQVDVPVLRRSTLELVASAAFTTLDSTKSQLVVRFVRQSGQPVSGVRVAMNGAERVVYDDVGGYSESASGTGTRGLAFLFNLAAATVPTSRVLSVSGPISAEFDVYVVAGGATVGDILVATN